MSMAETDAGATKRRGKRWWLPRLSLFSFLLLAALVCVCVSHYRLMQENLQLSKRNQQLMDQAGLLVVHDPNKVYIRRVVSVDDLTFRIQIYLPPNKGYVIYTRADPYSGGGGTSIRHYDEQFWLVVTLRRDTDGQWWIRAIWPQSGHSNSASAQVAEQMLGQGFLSDYQMGQEQIELDPDKKFDLLNFLNGDFHVWMEPSGTNATAPKPRRKIKR